MEELTSLSC